jgi:hypothetical protein
LGGHIHPMPGGRQESADPPSFWEVKNSVPDFDVSSIYGFD